MTGHEPILAMRRARRKPAFVTVSDRPCHTDWAKWGDQPVVCVAGDTPELLDLRFLVGTTALVEGFDEARVARIAKVCEPIAARVIATVARPIDTWRTQVVSVTDTEGALTWNL